jgi:hypothetical protein
LSAKILKKLLDWPWGVLHNAQLLTAETDFGQGGGGVVEGVFFWRRRAGSRAGRKKSLTELREGV